MTEGTKTMLLERQKEYKLAALRAKKEGDMEQAKLYFKTSKVSAGVGSAAVNKPPSEHIEASQPATEAPDVLEALEQRRVKYVEASNQAKASGDDRKARMHDRIAKVAVPEKPKKPTLDVPTAGPEQKRSPSASPGSTSPKESPSPTDFFCPHLSAVQLLELLESRKKQYMKAALQAKQKNDMEQAKVFLRTAKGLDPMIEAARSGKTVDISTVSRQPKATF
ncbi:hypothetical protein GOODEAATRI_001361, partial [Goodea atripinnis]